MVRPMLALNHHLMPDGRRIAFRHVAGAGPAVVFLPGYMSDMEGSKATALIEKAREDGRECLLFDYSGCGKSDGDFAQGTLTRWRDEVLALVETRVAAPGVVLVGSSMGGWLMLLAGLTMGARRAKELTGLVGIASAPDFSHWDFDEGQKALLSAGETIFKSNPYGSEPTPIHARFWEDAERHCLLDGSIALTCPARLLHGLEDADVPWRISLELADALGSPDVQVVLVKGGDHRLSRERDITLLLRTVDELAPIESA